ncbi:MAG: hypothetical protein EZS28_035937 [Streblomastix strix]|uniref:non-specific serine/threonine protein kinase n=1 Tax=Streblomastix strix TaxID=222440 RepID=A0A5J4UCL2_9EUKA|nr:MAG: hypothetical protein EZS28_035937 [Streblomastix strix]
MKSFCCRSSTTEQSDIFAFGCVIFELLTGQHPFQGKSKQEHEMIENIKNGKVAQLPDWVSQGMKEIVMTMLSKKSEDRPKASVILEQDTIKMYLRSRNMNTRSNIPNNQTNQQEQHLHTIEQQKREIEQRLRTFESRIQIVENEKRQSEERARLAEEKVRSKEEDIQRLQIIIVQLQSSHNSTSHINTTHSAHDLSQRTAFEDTTTELENLDTIGNRLHLVQIGGINRKAIILKSISIVIPLDKVISDGIWRLSVRFDGCNSGQSNQYANGCIGISKADNTISCPCFPGSQPYTQYMLDFHGNGTSFYKGNKTEGNAKFVDGQLVTLELDKDKGNMRFFIDDKLQPIYVRGIIQPVKFYCFMYKENSSFTVISLKKLPSATTETLANEKVVQWQTQS